MKEFQKILDEVMEIARIPMLLYDMDAACVASTADVSAVPVGSVADFIHSQVESLSLGTFHYFKIICAQVPSYVLLVAGYTPDAFTIGRLTVCRLRQLLESHEETVTKSGFLRALLNGSLTPTEQERQIHRLKLSKAEWAVFVIECADGFHDSCSYQLLEHAFTGNKPDMCCELDARHLVLVKELAAIRREFGAKPAKTADRRRKKDDTPADALVLSACQKRFAQTLVDTLRAEALVPTHVGYGTPVGEFSALPRAFREAATALSIRATFFAEQDTIAYDRLGIGRLIAELPTELCNAFLYEVFGNSLPDDLDEETQNTIQKFYENNLNISETARQLYLHRNTLVYRLERLEKTLGLDIRKFEDAMTFKLAMMVLAHVRSKAQKTP